jgi:hypothetical protein
MEIRLQLKIAQIVYIHLLCNGLFGPPTAAYISTKTTTPTARHQYTLVQYSPTLGSLCRSVLYR